MTSSAKTNIRCLLASLLLLALVAALAMGYLLQRFEPGGGGAEPLPPVVEVNGSVRLQLRLTVWGGGGSVSGRYSPVMLSFKPSGPGSFQQQTGRLIQSDASSEVYEFVLSRAIVGVTGPVDYQFEITLDGHTTTIAGKELVTVS